MAVESCAVSSGVVFLFCSGMKDEDARGDRFMVRSQAE